MTQALHHPVDIQVEKIALTPSHLDATLLVDGKLIAVIEGFVSPFSAYDIDYEVQAKDNQDIAIRGHFEGDIHTFTLAMKGLAFGGDIDVAWTHEKNIDKDINVAIKHLHSATALQFFDIKPLFAGTMDIQADVAYFSEYQKEGKVSFVQSRAGVYLDNLYQLSHIHFPKDFMCSGSGEIVLGDGAHDFNLSLKSNVAEIQLDKGRYLEANQRIESLYHVRVKELKKLSFITGKVYAGGFEGKGRFHYQKELYFDGETPSFGALIPYRYEHHDFRATLRDVPLAMIFKHLNYPIMMLGSVDGKIGYNTQDKIAIINLESQDAHIPQSGLTGKIASASGVDLSKERFSDTFFAASIEQGIIAYDLTAKHKLGFVALRDVKMDAHKNTIDATFDVKLQEQELSGKIYGSLASPRVKLDVAKYLEYKAKKEIDAFFGIGTTQKVKKKLKEVDTDKVKGFFKNFF